MRAHARPLPPGRCDGERSMLPAVATCPPGAASPCSATAAMWRAAVDSMRGPQSDRYREHARPDWPGTRGTSARARARAGSFPGRPAASSVYVAIARRPRSERRRRSVHASPEPAGTTTAALPVGQSDVHDKTSRFPALDQAAYVFFRFAIEVDELRITKHSVEKWYA